MREGNFVSTPPYVPRSLFNYSFLLLFMIFLLNLFFSEKDINVKHFDVASSDLGQC